MGTIYEGIAAVMNEIGPIAKGRRNQQQGFQYRGVDDVMNELQPMLAKHGVFVVPQVKEAKREEHPSKNGGTLFYSILTVDVGFFSSDGTSVHAIVIGEGMDSGDKASNKALSVAFKYACLQVFCIPTEDTKDPDGDSQAPARRPAAETPPSAPAAPKAPAPAPAAPAKPKMTRGQVFNSEIQYAGLTNEEAKKAVYTVIDAFDYPKISEAVNAVDEITFKKMIDAIKNAGVNKEAANA